MNTYYASGTIGDAYIVLCKLYSKAKKEQILCRHHTIYDLIKPTIKEIYSLVPNISVEFEKIEKPALSITGWFHHPSWERERDRQRIEQGVYKLEPEYYPQFELGEIEHSNLPKSYDVFQIESGIGRTKRLGVEKIREILSNSKAPLVLIGKDGTGPLPKNREIIDLRGKTSVREAVNIIRNSGNFYGPQGFLSFVAVSQKVFATVFLIFPSDVLAIQSRIETVEQWRRFFIRR